MKWILVAALLTAACGKKSDSGAAPSCADAIGKAVGSLPAGSGGGGIQAQLRTILTTRCTEDKWPAATIQCYATVTNMQGMRACRESLPPALAQKVQNEIRGAMTGAGGPMHGGPMGPGPHGMAPHGPMGPGHGQMAPAAPGSGDASGSDSAGSAN